ncbi:hypothetical protein MG293_018610 [Ovis ammon polii]|uniref:Serpin domain-containing protein n=1 Tax=Ovis ammon polii TaxID=230172 RepID=A0AAD4TQE5_OVIAM|nr:hypothetical protein MG293_018610 [Ovis ammon polii]
MGAAPSLPGPRVPSLATMDALSEGNGTFALTLLTKLGADNSKNVFISPLSISSALAMVLMGAKGNTAAQMCQTLSLSKCRGEEHDVHQAFERLLSEVNMTGTQYLLRTANRLFGQKPCDFLLSFKYACRVFYQAEVEELDFVSASEESRKHMNTWVAEKTEGKIRDLLPENSLNPMTRLVLVNAIYFKGNWDEQFNKEFTQEKPFRVSKGWSVRRVYRLVLHIRRGSSQVSGPARAPETQFKLQTVAVTLMVLDPTV